MFGIDLIQLVSTAGYFGIAAIIFAESGLFIGAVLPGDSLLFTTGLLSSRGLFDIRLMIPLLMAAAVIGDSVGFSIGRKLGPRLFAKEDTRIFKKKYLVDAQKFFDKHGGKAIILARFIPAVRSFTPMIAGAANMNYGNFIKYNIFGGIFWVLLLTLLGYFLGESIPDIDKYLLPIIGGIVLLSLIPLLSEIYKAKFGKKKVD